MIIKVKSWHEPGTVHVKDRIYTGPDKDHLQYAGELIFSFDNLYSIAQGEAFKGMVSDWQLFGTALGLGARRMGRAVEVIIEGDEEATRSVEAEISARVKKMAHG